jgi:hypothetical protein
LLTLKVRLTFFATKSTLYPSRKPMTTTLRNFAILALFALAAGACNKAPTAPHIRSVRAAKPSFNEVVADSTSRNGGTAGSGYRINTTVPPVPSSEETADGGGTAGSGY